MLEFLCVAAEFNRTQKSLAARRTRQHLIALERFVFSCYPVVFRYRYQRHNVYSESVVVVGGYGSRIAAVVSVDENER